MSIVIPAYGSVPECPKCCAPAPEMVSTTYHAEAQMHIQESPPCVHLFMNATVDEGLEEALENHLCRVCRRCGYGWVERALDAPEPNPDGLCETREDAAECEKCTNLCPYFETLGV